MAARVGAVSIDLRANSAQFAADMKRATSALDRSQSRMRRSLRKVDGSFLKLGRSLRVTTTQMFGLRTAFSRLGAALTIGVFGIVLQRSIAAADQIGKVADKVGLTTDELQEMRFAADQTGVAITALDMGMQRFSRRLGEAANGSGELKDTIERLGIELRDDSGAMRSVTDILGDYAEAVKNATSDQEQLLLAFKGFDSEGAALVNLLRQGRDGITRFKEEANRLGLVLDEKMIRAAEKANDELSKMRQIVGVNLTRLMIGLAPMIVRMGAAFANAAPRIKQFVEAFLPLNMLSVEGLQTRINIAAADIARIDEMLSEWTTIITPGAAPGLRKRREKLIAEIHELTAALATAAEQQATIDSALALPTGEGADTAGVEAAQQVIESLRFEQQQLHRTALEQRLFNEMRRAGTQATAEQATEIANLVVLIHAENGRREENARLAKEQAEQLAKNTEMLRREAEEYEDQLNRQQAVIDQWRGTIEDALTSIIMRSKTATDALREMALAIVAAGIKQAVVAPIVGAVLGSIGFGGGKAAGGPVSAGTAYLVGEQGPELFVPQRSGFIQPNTGGPAAGGDRIVYNIDARGADVSVERRLMQALRQVDRSIEPRAVTAVADNVQRGGQMANVMRGRR